jgi:hypothetical protein
MAATIRRASHGVQRHKKTCADPAGQEQLTRGPKALDLLDADGIAELHAAAVADLPAEEARARDLCPTVLPALADPQRFAFLKPTPTTELAAIRQYPRESPLSPYSW